MTCVPALPARVVAQWVPAFYLHHNERYWPASVEWFLERAELFVVLGDSRCKLLSEGEVTQEKLLGVQAQVGGKLVLDISPRYHCGPDPDHLSDVPVYVNVKLVCHDDGQPESYEINYMTFYPFNGWYKLMGLPCVQAGGHVGDWEHCTVRLDSSTLQLQGVWYNSHRNIEGEWTAAKDVPRTADGRIIAYVAINGHGVYPRAGTIHRLFWVANDYTSRHGRVWRPSQAVLMCGLEHGNSVRVATSRGCSLPDGPPVDAAHVAGPPASSSASLPEVVEDSSLWQRFGGRWGTSLAPARQGWFNQAEPPVSRSFTQRLCLPLARGVERLPRRMRHPLHPEKCDLDRDRRRGGGGTDDSPRGPGLVAAFRHLGDRPTSCDECSAGSSQPLMGDFSDCNGGGGSVSSLGTIAGHMSAAEAGPVVTTHAGGLPSSAVGPAGAIRQRSLRQMQPMPGCGGGAAVGDVPVLPLASAVL